MLSCLLVISYLRLLWYHSPFQAYTAFTLPRYLLLRPAGIACGFLTFSFSGVGLLAPCPTPNLEDLETESPGDGGPTIPLDTG
jgi:hypothetical protein